MTHPIAYFDNAATSYPKPDVVYEAFRRNAEFERDLIRDRTSAGRREAKTRGVKFGRPSKVTPAQMKVINQLLADGQSIRQIADTFGIHYTTLYRLLRL